MLLAASSVLVLLPTLGGCQSHDASSPAVELKKAIARAENPQPEHIVEIDGRLPPSLGIVLFAQYWTDTEDRSCFVMPQAEWGQGPNYFREQLTIERQADRYQARVIVDKFLPGQCNWALKSVDANIVRTKSRNDVGSVEDLISTYLYRGGSDSSGCDGTGYDDCPEEENALAAPVVVPCKTADSNGKKNGDRASRQSLFCNALTKRSYKEGHRLRPEHKKVQIDFYDLEIDPDPTVK